MKRPIVVDDEELAQRLRREIDVLRRRLDDDVTKKAPIAERESELWKVDAEAAIRVFEWFDLLVKLRRAADTVPPDLLVKEFRNANLPLLEHDRLWLMQLIEDRFKGDRDSRDKIAQAKKSSGGGKAGALTRQEDAEEWQTRIKPLVQRLIRAGKSSENIGALLASKAGRSAEHVADFAAKVKAELAQG
jgi:hypothetical protein